MKRKKERRNFTLNQLEKRLKIANNITNLSLALAILGCILMLKLPISSKKIMPFYITWAGIGILIVSISSEVAIKMREKINQIND